MSLTYQQLMNELKRLVESRSDGTLYIHSNCNHAVTYTLESGRITALYFGPRKGRKAIPLARDITGGSCHFEESAPGRAPQDLPSTEEIMRLLLSSEAAPGATGDSQSKSSISSNTEDWSGVLERLQTVLTDHLGPIAGIILDESLEELDGNCVSEASFQRLVDTLARNIETDQIALFRDQAASVLNNRS